MFLQKNRLLAVQYGLSPGAKVYVDNLFTSLDLLNNLGGKHIGITGTLCQNRIIGIHVPYKGVGCCPGPGGNGVSPGEGGQGGPGPPDKGRDKQSSYSKEGGKTE